jgi:TRAP-type C4-dicarboxylate transport system permease small subunit
MHDPSEAGQDLVDTLLDRWIGPAVDWIVGGLVGALVLLVGSGVLSRYVLNYSLAWSDELAGLGFVWLTLLGSVAACRRRTHMAMGFFPKWFGPAGQRRVGLYVNAAVILFLAATVIEGVHLTLATMDDRSAVLRISVGLAYLSLPVAGVLMAAYVGRQARAVWLSIGGWSATADTEED